jgi:hypothetical protein
MTACSLVFTMIYRDQLSLDDNVTHHPLQGICIDVFRDLHR